MANAPSHSPQREISLGSTPLPSFTGRQQQTSNNRYMLLTIYIATCAARVFTFTRWNRTHRAGHILQSPCLMKTTLYTSLHHVATPMLCADTEEPEREPLLQGPLNIGTCAARVFTMTRWNRSRMAGHVHQLPCLMQTTLETSLFTNRQQAATQRATETPELLQDRLHTHVRRSTTTAPYTELAHSYQDLLTPIISIRCIHYFYYAIIQKPEIHRP